jgi:hypothetical protein
MTCIDTGIVPSLPNALFLPAGCLIFEGPTGAQRRHSFETSPTNAQQGASAAEGVPENGTQPKPKSRRIRVDTSDLGSDLASALSRKLERMQTYDCDCSVDASEAVSRAGDFSRSSSKASAKGYNCPVQKSRMMSSWTGKFCKSRDFLGVRPFMVPEVPPAIIDQASSRRGSVSSRGSKCLASSSRTTAHAHAHIPCSLYSLTGSESTGLVETRRQSNRRSRSGSVATQEALRFAIADSPVSSPAASMGSIALPSDVGCNTTCERLLSNSSAREQSQVKRVAPAYVVNLKAASGMLKPSPKPHLHGVLTLITPNGWIPSFRARQKSADRRCSITA